MASFGSSREANCRTYTKSWVKTGKSENVMQSRTELHDARFR